MAQSNQQQPAGAQGGHGRKPRGCRGGQKTRSGVARPLHNLLHEAQQAATSGQNGPIVLKLFKTMCDTLRGAIKDIVHASRPSVGPFPVQQQREQQPQRAPQQQQAAVEHPAPQQQHPSPPKPPPAPAPPPQPTSPQASNQRSTRSKAREASLERLRNQSVLEEQVRRAAQPQLHDKPPAPPPPVPTAKRPLGPGLKAYNQQRTEQKAQAAAQAAIQAATAAASGLGGTPQDEQRAEEVQQPPGPGAAPTSNRQATGQPAGRQEQAAAAVATAAGSASTTTTPAPGPSTGAGDGRTRGATRSRGAQHTTAPPPARGRQQSAEGGEHDSPGYMHQGRDDRYSSRSSYSGYGSGYGGGYGYGPPDFDPYYRRYEPLYDRPPPPYDFRPHTTSNRKAPSADQAPGRGKKGRKG